MLLMITNKDLYYTILLHFSYYNILKLYPFLCDILWPLIYFQIYNLDFADCQPPPYAACFSWYPSIRNYAS